MLGLVNDLSSVLTGSGVFTLCRTLRFLRPCSNLAQLFEVPNVQPRSFSLSLRAKRILKRFRLDNVRSLTINTQNATKKERRSVTHFPQIRIRSIIK